MIYIKGFSDMDEQNIVIYSDARAALEELKQYKGSVSSDIDEKTELYEARDEKYVNLYSQNEKTA